MQEDDTMPDDVHLIKEVQALRARRLLRTLAVVQDLSDALMAVNDVTGGDPVTLLLQLASELHCQHPASSNALACCKQNTNHIKRACKPLLLAHAAMCLVVCSWKIMDSCLSMPLQAQAMHQWLLQDQRLHQLQQLPHSTRLASRLCKLSLTDMLCCRWEGASEQLCSAERLWAHVSLHQCAQELAQLNLSGLTCVANMHTAFLHLMFALLQMAGAQ